MLPFRFPYDSYRYSIRTVKEQKRNSQRDSLLPEQGVMDIEVNTIPLISTSSSSTAYHHHGHHHDAYSSWKRGFRDCASKLASQSRGTEVEGKLTQRTKS